MILHLSLALVACENSLHLLIEQVLKQKTFDEESTHCDFSHHPKMKSSGKAERNSKDSMKA